MNKELPSTITDLLKEVNDNQDDENKAYLLAATFNLYSEAMRRFHGRILLGPADIRAILEMAHTMIVVPPQFKLASPKPEERTLTVSEEEQVQNAVAPEHARRSL